MDINPNVGDESSVDFEVLNAYLETHDLPDIAWLEGFFVAIVSSPDIIDPSQWMIWLGISDSGFLDIEEASVVMGTLIFMQNRLSEKLMDSNYYPIAAAFFEESEQEALQCSLQSWAMGYMDGAGIVGILEDCDDTLHSYIFPILSAALNDDDARIMIKEIDTTGKLTLDTIRLVSFDDMARSASLIYAYCTIESEPGLGEFLKKIGRNDPCFCGSGKKFKKCCLH